MIRSATTQDTARLLELEQIFPNAMPETMLTRELEVGVGYVAEREGRVVGYALVRQDGELLDLTRLAVDPACQGAGIGKALLKHVLSLGQPTMLTVQKDNHRALALYLRAGFQVVGHLVGATAWALHRPAQPWGHQEA